MNRNSYIKIQNPELHSESYTQRSSQKNQRQMQYQIQQQRESIHQSNQKFMNAYPFNNKHRQRIYGRNVSPLQREPSIQAYPAKSPNKYGTEETASRVSIFLNRSVEKNGSGNNYPLGTISRAYMNESQNRRSSILAGRSVERAYEAGERMSCVKESKENLLVSKSFQGALPSLDAA